MHVIKGGMHEMYPWQLYADKPRRIDRVDAAGGKFREVVEKGQGSECRSIYLLEQ